jgi:hypothetical protein
MKTDSKRPLNLERVRSPTAADLIDRVLDKGIVVECQNQLLSSTGFLVGVDGRGVSIAPLDHYPAPLEKTGFLADTWFREPTGTTPARARRGPRR